MRIIARPTFKHWVDNPYNWLLYLNIKNLGHHADEYTPASILKGGL